MSFKPMLAAAADFSMLRFPLYASYKIDGIRATIHHGQAMSRSMKPIPSRYIQRWVAKNDIMLDGLDGEFVVGQPNDQNVFNTTTSHVMALDKEGFDFTFHVFDVHTNGLYYAARLKVLKEREYEFDSHVKLHGVKQLFSLGQLEDYEQLALDDGYEGVMTRDPLTPYKQGRATSKGQELLKIKRTTDMEASVIFFEERMHNANEAFTNELGRTARSSAQAGQVGTNALGAFVVTGLNGKFKDVTFNVGTGFTEAQRVELWRTRDEIFGATIKLRYFDIGSIDKPRHPTFLGFRHADDMSQAAD